VVPGGSREIKIESIKEENTKKIVGRFKYVKMKFLT